MADDTKPPVVHVTIDTFNDKGKVIEVDATVSEEHNFEADVSAYPIEDGTTIVDNVRVKPLSIKLDCIVSDTPLVERSSITGFEIRQADAYQALLDLFNAKEQVAITTSLSTYEDMVCVGLSFPRTASNGQALVFTANFQQVIIIDNERRTVATQGRNGSPKDPKAFALVFSVVVTRAAEFLGFQIMVSDKIGPTKDGDGKAWNHYKLATGNGFVNNGAADGWVTLIDGVYHRFDNKGRLDGFSLDNKTGLWKDAHGKPLPTSPVAPAANGRIPLASGGGPTAAPSPILKDWFGLTAEDL